jgi:hypothetical protein
VNVETPTIAMLAPPAPRRFTFLPVVILRPWASAHAYVTIVTAAPVSIMTWPLVTTYLAFSTPRG